jgi:hypothetical protein
MKRKKMFYDDRDFMLRTHVVLQEIKRYGGTKVFLEARKLLLVAWLACREGENGNPQFPALQSYYYTLTNLENYKTANQKTYHYGNLTSLREALGYYPHYNGGKGFFFSVPYSLFMDKTTHQILVNLENYFILERRRHLESMIEEEADWDDDILWAAQEEEEEIDGELIDDFFDQL